MCFYRAVTGLNDLSSAKRILLIIGGGIAAYKCLDLIRRLRERGHSVRAVMTKAAHHFVTPLSVGALTNERVLTDLFDLDDEREIGHIRLARDNDLIVVAPATADLIARMAGGHADDLATAVLLATEKPVVLAPAMNPAMWRNPATRRNVAQLKADGIRIIGPAVGEMAERGEAGPGRLVEVPDLIAAIEGAFEAGASRGGVLEGRHVIITSGPTHEPIDPIRYLANRSSGKQGFELAAAAAELGARVTLITGPVSLSEPAGVEIVRIKTAAEMLEAVKAALPADIAVFAAAVADWRVETIQTEKIKKSEKAGAPTLSLTENPDILKMIARPGPERPRLVIGFAAETQNVLTHAQAKLKSKRADWIVANDVSPSSGVMGGENNTVHLITASGVDSWPEMSKAKVARKLMERAAEQLHAKRTAAE
ncbi:bifunctional phosphopantothenoylcysteine decarboxylase/phosphopantothenate--cysteine ligase CoaBC [Hyphomicrobium sp. ghe19]|uniref:bifunctional phosphopantothenoylcysteine decarboxylase/phosphopantothenate--cysteine ligase CoaBC n=1 Tax=Hyphomicrobium sp. ghe19 TaxID=2682968 RepID=UPI0013670224|nr:Coenzyme A biosynthesis bifunctional protein CoaBC [Hyphomicrobium sp. ghe19]